MELGIEPLEVGEEADEENILKSMDEERPWREEDPEGFECADPDDPLEYRDDVRLIPSTDIFVCFCVFFFSL